MATGKVFPTLGGFIRDFLCCIKLPPDNLHCPAASVFYRLLCVQHGFQNGKALVDLLIGDGQRRQQPEGVRLGTHAAVEQDGMDRLHLGQGEKAAEQSVIAPFPVLRRQAGQPGQRLTAQSFFFSRDSGRSLSPGRPQRSP